MRVAAFVGGQSTLFDWPTGEELGRFCAEVDPPGSPDLRQQARSEFAVLLANYGAGQLGIRTQKDEPLFLNPAAGVACGVARASTVRELADSAHVTAVLIGASYLNNVADNRRPITGVSAGLEFFGGGAGLGASFLGSTIDPYSMTVPAYDRTWGPDAS